MNGPSVAYFFVYAYDFWTSDNLCTQNANTKLPAAPCLGSVLTSSGLGVCSLYSFCLEYPALAGVTLLV